MRVEKSKGPRTVRFYNFHFLLICILALMGMLSGCRQEGLTQAKQETVYDRVIKAKKIRAAYLTYPPACMKDNSGKLKGIFIETLEKAAENLGLSVEWGEEVGWGSQIEGLQTDRYDIVGSPVWANPTRGKLTTLSIPLYYSGIGIYVRKDKFENQFVNNWQAINSPNVRISTIDGETGDLIARTQFPLAKRVSLPQTADISQLFLEVSNNKADVMFAEPYFANEYFKNNPENLKNIAAEKPIRVLGNCYMFKKGEVELKHMLDVALEDLLNSGFVDTLIDRYEGRPNTFYRISRPYRLMEVARAASAAK
jgi:polar amino acid transport system substrate-binding protein